MANLYKNTMFDLTTTDKTTVYTCPTDRTALVKTIQVVTAALGVLLIAMWLFTDHVDTWANWNMIWTIPALATLVSKRNVVLPNIAIALYLLVGPLVWPQYMSLSFWLVAISVFLTLTPQSK